MVKTLRWLQGQYKRAFKLIYKLRWEMALIGTITLITQGFIVFLMRSLDPVVISDAALRHGLEMVLEPKEIKYDYSKIPLYECWWLYYFLVNGALNVLAIVMGFIPFYFVSSIFLVQNSLHSAIMIGAIRMVGHPLWKIIVYGYLPHGLFEIPANFISQMVGMYDCYNLTVNLGIKMARHRKKRLEQKGKVVNSEINDWASKKIKTTSKELFWDSIRVYGLIVLPLLAIASPIEAYVTPWLIQNIK